MLQSNTPTLTSSSGTNGYYYVVATAGSTNLNGITDWAVRRSVDIYGLRLGKRLTNQRHYSLSPLTRYKGIDES